MIVKNQQDLDGLKKIGSIVAQTLELMLEKAEPGITTQELDDIAKAEFKKRGAVSAPISTNDFPGQTCISVNEEIAHGIPGPRVIKAGDTVNIDVSASLNGYFADTAATKLLDPISKNVKKLSKCCLTALDKAIGVAIAGNKLNLIGKVVEQTAKKAGFKVIRNLCGHGVGRDLHEEPSLIPSFYDRRDKRVLENGLVIAIEPFIAELEDFVYEDKHDGWTLRTPRHTRAIQYEHTIVVTEDEPIIITMP